MTVDELTATATSSPANRGSEIGLRFELRTNPVGVTEIEALPDHRLLVHLGAPARGVWQSRDVYYTGGDIDFFPAGVSTSWEQIDAVNVVDVLLTPSLVRHVAEGAGVDPDRPVAPNCHFRDAQIEHITRALEAERRAGHPGGSLYTDSLGTALAVRLLDSEPRPTAFDRGLSPGRLRRVTEYIEEHLDQDLTLAHLADVAGVSASHLKTLFRRSTGLPVHRYVVERRVERATTLLLDGDVPASQVALIAGFSHQSHMALWMRRVLGVTPSELVHDGR